MRSRRVVALALASLAATLMIVPASAGASSVSAAAAHRARSIEWRPGSRLPKVPKDFWLVAWPSPQVLKKLKAGQTVPVVHVKPGTKAAEIRRYKHLENRAGIVNLELEPTGQSSANGAKAAPCHASPWVFEGAIGKEAATVAQSYSTIPNVTQYFTYGTGQSSTVEVGISVSGEDGTFGESGTMSVATDNSWGFTPQQNRSFNHWQTYFEWGLYYSHTTGLCGNIQSYVEQPYQVDGGSNYVHPSGAPKAVFCVPAHRKDSVSGRNTAAATIKAGFDVLGFEGSVQTGYTKTGEITIRFHLARGQKAQACGTVNYPLSPDPGVLVASK